ncbi:MI domain-containing protein [Aphis craccivora]|uniref:MI domain-containing protein n=1 Tax=Aphis craccivora TaxID=307492 RepID=A0A6G0YRN8_APHCR|nr:MI domain-containing protein [Aphis craccivora]
MSNKCYSCNELFAELDNPLKCDSCSSIVHNKCSGLSATELKCLGLKKSCDQGLKELPELKILIKKLLVEVDNIKNDTANNINSTNNINFLDEFVINEINDRNRRANNLIFYNVDESECNRHDISVPLKVIRLGRFQPGKMRPIKTIFSMATDVFDIIRNKKKISHSNLPSTINISTDRTPNQRESMKKLCEELASRTNNGEIGLTIKFQRGVPKIIKIIDRCSNLYNRGGGILLAIKNTFNCKLLNPITIIPNIDQIILHFNYSLIPLIDSYYPPLDFIYSLEISEILDEPNSPELFNYNSCNYLEIIEFLENIDILANIINLDLDNAILKFYDILNHICNLFIPKTKLNRQFNYSLPWSNYDLRNLIKEKKLAHKKSILEFGSLIWSSDYSTYKSDLDNLQFKFLKRIAHVICYNLSHCSVKHLQDSIEVHYLEVRRNLADIMFIFDILNGFVICPEILALINFRIPRKSTRNLDLFKIPFYKTNIGTNSFLPRVLFLANIISATLDFFNMSRYTFKANTPLYSASLYNYFVQPIIKVEFHLNRTSCQNIGNFKKSIKTIIENVDEDCMSTGNIIL